MLLLMIFRVVFGGRFTNLLLLIVVLLLILGLLLIWLGLLLLLQDEIENVLVMLQRLLPIRSYASCICSLISDGASVV